VRSLNFVLKLRGAGTRGSRCLYTQARGKKSLIAMLLAACGSFDEFFFHLLIISTSALISTGLGTIIKVNKTQVLV
jgi:hypothetical protein